MEFGMPTAQPTILHGIHHTNPQKVLFLIVKGNVNKTFQFATGVTSTDWFVTWNCLDYIIVGRLAAACVCSHCHISPLTNAVSKTSPCFLCFLFSLSLAFSSESVSKTCRIWCSFFFLSQVRNTCLSMCIYIMQLVLVLYLSEQWQCFLQSPTLDYLISADQPRSSQEIEAVTLGFLSSELISIKRLVYHSHFPHQWIGRGGNYHELLTT